MSRHEDTARCDHRDEGFGPRAWLDEALRDDMHVHSTFSDGKASLAENIAQAEIRGLRRMCCVDHVRRDTAWLPEFIAAVHSAQQTTSVELWTGVEAKLLDDAGTLDVPDDLTGVDLVYAADHQVPVGSGRLSPHAVRARIEAGELGTEQVVRGLVAAYIGAIERYERLVIAHPFSVLPKLHLSEQVLPDELVVTLGESAAAHGARFELSEAWRCPSPRVLALLVAQGVSFVTSTDSHVAARIGRYRYVRDTLAAIHHGHALQ